MIYIKEMHIEIVSIKLDIKEDESPIIIGMVIQRHTIKDNITTQPRLIMKRPIYNRERNLDTYM